MRQLPPFSGRVRPWAAETRPGSSRRFAQGVRAPRQAATRPACAARRLSRGCRASAGTRPGCSWPSRAAPVVDVARAPVVEVEHVDRKLCLGREFVAHTQAGQRRGLRSLRVVFDEGPRAEVAKLELADPR